MVTERSDVTQILAEIFREHGYAGASLSEITNRTGLGKGSLYHLFPDGKEGMARAVLFEVADWFEENVFMPMRAPDNPDGGIDHMFTEVLRFFDTGRRTCLMGAFALDDARDRFPSEIQAYFLDWTRMLATALRRSGFEKNAAREAAEEVVAGIQGALVLARSLGDPAIFVRAIKRLRKRTGLDQQV